jgi:antitoxin component YwqK of YwqJK toxin-antitoxin module
MKYKKVIILFSFLFILFFAIVSIFRTSDSLLGHISSKVINGNTIKLHFTNINKFSISTISENCRTLIFKNHKLVNKIEKDVYGPFYFEITFKNNLKVTLGHWKFVNWGAHSYSISAVNKKVGYYFTFEADGPDYTKINCSYDLKGKKHGQYVSYYRNGNKELKSFYNHGKLNGKETFYNENGKIRVIQEWKNGVLKQKY